MPPEEREAGARFLDAIWPDWRDDVPPDQVDDVIERFRGTLSFAGWRFTNALRVLGHALLDAFALPQLVDRIARFLRRRT